MSIALRRPGRTLGQHGLAALATLAVFQDRLELAAACWMMALLGDGAERLVGGLLRGPALPWNAARRWSGLIASTVYGGTGAALVVRGAQQAVLGGGALASRLGPAFPPDTGSAGATWLVAACMTAAGAASCVASLDSAIPRPFRLALVAGAALHGLADVEPRRLAGVAVTGLAWGAAAIAPLAALAYLSRAADFSGALAGWLLGVTLYAFAGWRAFLVMAAFAILGGAVTQVGSERKQALGVAHPSGGRRSARHVIANGLVGTVLGVLAATTSWPLLYRIGLVAAFAAAAADTAASEIGQPFGGRHVLPTTWRTVPAGTEGAVSMTGTLAGLVAALVVAAVGLLVALVPASSVAVIVAAALGATLAESFLGAWTGGRGRDENEVLNLINTGAGAMFAVLLARGSGIA